MRKNERLIDMRSYPISWDWHSFALDLACKGFTRSEIYGRICVHSEQIGNHAPQRCTVTNYLRKHKAQWEYVSKDRPLQDPEPPKNREFRNLKNATIRAARELYYAPIYISQLQAATTEAQLNMIMRTARQHSYEEDL